MSNLTIRDGIPFIEFTPAEVEAMDRAKEEIRRCAASINAVMTVEVNDKLAAINAQADEVRQKIASAFALPFESLPLHTQQRYIAEMREHEEHAHLRAIGYTGTLAECRDQQAREEMAAQFERIRRNCLGRAGRAIEDEKWRRKMRAMEYDMSWRITEYIHLPRRERKRIERIMGMGFPSRCRAIRDARNQFYGATR